MTPIALTIAGSDSSGGAGIQADLKTFAALGIYGASAITALTAQNTLGVQAIHPVPAAFVRRQIASVLDDLRVDAVKIGMLAEESIVAAVAAELGARRARHVVLDPVMVATSGDRLISETAVAALRDLMFPLAEVITPNLPEAAALLGDEVAADEAAMADQARRLLAFGPRAVLIKGGHGGGPESVDLLVDASGTRRLSAPRHPTRHTHGTGCTLSAALAAFLARGAGLEDAAGKAKRYLTAAIAGGDRLGVGSGSGPVDHFHAFRH